MIEVRWKPDIEASVARFEAWWAGEIVDRPPITLHVAVARRAAPPAGHASLRGRWLDAEHAVESAIARMAGREWLADTLPVFMPNVGPEVTATLYGCRLEFTADTSWSQPIVRDVADWAGIARTPPDFGNEHWQAIERMTRLALQRREGRYLVGLTDLHGNYDILAALRDPQDLCVDLLDDPDLVERAALHVAQGFVEATRRNWRILSEAGMPSTTWIPALHRGLFYVPSCDFWCTISTEMARRRVLPSIAAEMAPLERSIFHLDGPDALRHLDLVLALPGLNAVQWVYGAGKGPASRWIETYRRILAAGKSVMLHAQDAGDALRVVEAAGARGVWIVVERGFDDVESARSFIAEVERLTPAAARRR